MKKIFKILVMTLLVLMLSSVTTFAAKDLVPITEVAAIDLDYPKPGKALDTSINLKETSYSYFMELNWDKTSDGFDRVTIKTRTEYDYIYDENTIATVNGNRATIVKNEESRILTFSYVFPEYVPSENEGPQNSSTVFHTISILYMKNGRISPNPIRAPHRKNTTVQIIPDEGYRVKDVVVDGDSVGAVTEYTFKRVTETHKIKAYFEPIPGYVPTEKEEVESGDVSLEKEETIYEFEDVSKNEWYYDAIQYVCANNIFSGASETTFEPDAIMTRAMIAKVLYNHAKENNLIKSFDFGENNFEDVPESEWYSEAVKWAVSNKVTNGTSNTNYSPDENLTREQLVTLLYRYAKSIEMDVSVGENTNILSYDDAFNISEYAIESFQWACGSGVITGKTESTLAPQELVTRAEVAMMIMRFNNIK